MDEDTRDACLVPTCPRQQVAYYGIYLCREHLFRMARKIAHYLDDGDIQDRDPIAGMIEMQPIFHRYAETQAESVSRITAGLQRDTPPRDIPSYYHSDGYVYFIRMVDRIKIGYTNNPARRLRELPWDEVLGIVPGTRQEEQVAHKLWKHLHQRGEWFHDHPDLRAWIASLPTVQAA